MVSNLADKNTIIQVSSSEIPKDEIKWCSVKLTEVINSGKRLEASVFDVESKKAYDVLEECKYNKVPLISSDGFVSNAHYGGRLKRNYVSKWDKDAIGFIGSSEMLDIKPQPVKFMSAIGNNIEQLRAKQGTVLISRSGTIGNLTIVNQTLSKLLISEHSIRLECFEYPGYVYAYLKSKIGQSLINSKIYGAIIQQIEPSHLADIPVPNPFRKLKQKINKLIMYSYELRDQSNELLDRANRLLIKELKLPSINEIEVEKFDNKYETLNYVVKLSDVSGRLDGSFHIPLVKTLMEYFTDNSKEVLKLGNRRVSKKIILPGRFKRVYVEEGQGKVFFGGKQLLELDPSNKKYLSLLHHGERIKGQLELHENMTMITCSGTIGKVTLVPKHWENWTANQHIIRVVPTDNQIAGYLSVFLASEYGYPFIKRYTYGSVVDEIDDRHVAEIPIPILKDQEIQKEINTCALKANELRYEAFIAEKRALKIMEEEVIHAK